MERGWRNSAQGVWDPETDAGDEKRSLELKNGVKSV